MEILQTLIRLQEQKRQKNVIPDYVTDVELYNEVISTVKTGLNKLYKDGKIGITQTLNHKAIYVK